MLGAAIVQLLFLLSMSAYTAIKGLSPVIRMIPPLFIDIE